MIDSLDVRRLLREAMAICTRRKRWGADSSATPSRTRRSVDVLTSVMRPSALQAPGTRAELASTDTAESVAAGLRGITTLRNRSGPMETISALIGLGLATWGFVPAAYSAALFGPSRSGSAAGAARDWRRRQRSARSARRGTASGVVEAQIVEGRARPSSAQRRRV